MRIFAPRITIFEYNIIDFVKVIVIVAVVSLSHTLFGEIKNIFNKGHAIPVLDEFVLFYLVQQRFLFLSSYLNLLY